MGIRVTCPAGHKLHVKTFLAGKRGVCPRCGAKFLIPLEQPSRPAALASPELRRIGPGESPPPSTDTFSDLGSQSVVIAVADSVGTEAPIAAMPASTPLPIVEAPVPSLPNSATAPPIVTLSPAADPPIIPLDSEFSQSPATRYAAKRERNRRKQITFAIMLFMAVIVLAGVLVFVLQRGARSAPVTITDLFRFDLKHQARSAQVAIP
jgi:hypothetical protein